MATASASGCANDACFSPPCPKIRTVPLLPLFYCLTSLENYQSPGTDPLSTSEHHRLKQISTGYSMCPSAASEVVGTKSVPVGTKYCRPAINSCRRQFLTATADQQCKVWDFRTNVCTDTLPIMQWTQGSMALDPRAINHAFQCMMARKPS